MPRIIRGDKTYETPVNIQGKEALQLMLNSVGTLDSCHISGVRFGPCDNLAHNFFDTTFEHCIFDSVPWEVVGFIGCRFVDCVFTGDNKWAQTLKGCMFDCQYTEPAPPTNEEIAKKIRAKVFSLPNKNFVKVCAECDFCHNHFYQIMSRTNVRPFLRTVPNCDKRVCDQCYKNYELRNKERGYRHYGYSGSLSFFRTPMDRLNTEILGLEMEFEGDFYGWKELQDAHRGLLHYGYDSSVRGENELSWDCGSYSWWKYLAPLKDVCDALKNNGGETGDTAGIHIHVSRPDIAMGLITRKINEMCSTGVFKTMMRAVSLRNDVDRFNTYANLDSPADAHHAGVSYNSHNTCEFRVFNSSLDHKLILRHLKFCKEFFRLVAEKTPQDSILPSFSKETKRHIRNCGKIQLEKGFITEKEFNELDKKLA